MRGNMVAYSLAEGIGGGEAFLDTVAASMARLRYRCERDCGLHADAAISLEIILDKDRLKY